MQFTIQNTKNAKLVLLFTTLGFCASSIAYSQTATDTDKNAPAKRVTSSKSQVDSKSKTEFLRLKTNSTGDPLALQTAITRFRPDDKNTIIDLVSAVHVGEAEYYEKLNQQFELYDVVLYELVAPEGTRVPKGAKPSSGNPISFLQQSAQKMLGLESQLIKIDYQKDNFTHADMSPADISKKMEERGDTAFSVGISAISEILKNQQKMAKEMKKNSDANQFASESIFELMSSPLKLKTMMAQQFTQTGVMETGLGSTLNQMLVVDRNAAALKVLKQELAKGNKHIAIFYGAAHMSDFEKRLTEDFGMKRTQQVWIDAWDLTKAPKAAQSSPTQMLFQFLKQIDN